MTDLPQPFNRPFTNLLSTLLVATTIATLSGAAAAQDRRAPKINGDGFDTHLFRPAVDSKGFFTVNGAEVLGHNDYSFGLVIDYGHNILRLKDNHGTDALITHSFQGTFQANYGLLNRAALGISVPVILMAGDQATNVGVQGNEYDSTRLNAQKLPWLGLHAKVRLLRNEQAIGLAIIAQGGFPVGDASRDLGGEPKPWFWPSIAVEKKFGTNDAVRLAANAGYRGTTGGAATEFDQLDSGRFQSSTGKLVGGAGASYRATEVLDIVAELYGSQQLGGSKSTVKSQTSQEVVGGIKLFLERNSYLMLGGGTRVTNGFEAADARGFVGFIFEPSIGDRDGDGFKDDEDDCPDDPEDFDGFQDTRLTSPPGRLGCPDPDNDNDGIPDKLDRCPNQPETRNGYKDEDGCPDVDDRDRDHDGIPDVEDACPDDPEDKDGFEDNDGCPDPDNDKDGVLDKDDKCPLDPEDKDGWQDEDGCPDPDNDGDRIPDKLDKCPNEPETYNGFQDEDGCPDKGSVVISENNIIILDKILFKTASAEILPQSNSILDAVHATLGGHPEFELIEVQGHADSRGDEQLNLRLTRDRANSVVDALVKRGTSRDRLRAMGFGKYCPLDPAMTPKAWDKNRRVEFKVIRTSGKATNAELGCEEAKKKGIVSPPVP